MMQLLMPAKTHSRTSPGTVEAGVTMMAKLTMAGTSLILG